MADIFDVDNQENYEVQEFDHQPSEEDYIASLEDKSMKSEVSEADFYGMMAQQTWIPEQIAKNITTNKIMKTGEVLDKVGVLDFGKMQEQINMDRHQLEMWGQSKTNATNPTHYNEVPADLQHWDVVERMGWGYHLGCATKYIWRAGKKSSSHLTDKQKEIEDLQKAIVYIQKRIDLII